MRPRGPNEFKFRFLFVTHSARGTVALALSIPIAAVLFAIAYRLVVS